MFPLTPAVLDNIRGQKFSLYTSNLLDVIYSPEHLATHKMTPDGGGPKPPMDQQQLKQIVVAVQSRFPPPPGVSLANYVVQIRNVIKNKMNNATKKVASAKKVKTSVTGAGDESKSS